MTQVFGPGSNTVSIVSIIFSLLFLAILFFGIRIIFFSPYMTLVDVAVDQPVPFSHEHHVSGLGIDCRYCHSFVEKTAHAGMPSTLTCMTCHSQVWTDAEVLQPVRDSFMSGMPIQWNRVHNLPDYVYFNHSIHVKKGVGCTTCHGRIDRMPFTHREQNLYMRWCLECHQQPEKFIRPVDAVFKMDWQASADQIERGRELVAEHGISSRQILNCSVCHH